MFADALKTLSSIDNTGSETFKRYCYQIACVLSTILQLSKESENFSVLLEVLDDFVIIDNLGLDTESITFVQVKSKQGEPITISTVLKEKWITKQAKNLEKFSDCKVKNILMTNLGIKTGESKIIDRLDLFPLNSLCPSDKERIINQISLETSIKDLRNFYLVRASVSLDKFEENLRGEMELFAERNHLLKLNVESLKAIYREIWQELEAKQKNRIEKEDLGSYERVFSKKGISFNYVKNIFDVTSEIQIPEPGVISSFVRNQGVFIGGLSILELGQNFKDFRVAAAKDQFNCIKQAREALKNNERFIKTETTSFGVSKKILEILDNDKIISSSIFYQNFRYSISTLFTEKYMDF